MNQPKPTHGIQHTDIDDAGVSRTMSLANYDDESYCLKIITKSDDEDDMVTQVLFTEYGIHMLRDFLITGLKVIEDYPVNNNE